MAVELKLNTEVVAKTAKMVAASMVKYQLHNGEPQHCPPDEFGGALFNRNGAPLNAQVIHGVQHPSFAGSGFDPNRLHDGVAISFKDYVKLKKHIDHNLKYTQGSNLYPPLNIPKVNKMTIAGSHTTCTLHCFMIGFVNPLSGFKYVVPDDDDVLRHWSVKGHKYILLSCDIPAEDAVEISNWKNADNGTCQVKHEMELIKSIQQVCIAEGVLSETVKVGQVAAKITSQSAIKLNVTLVALLIKYACDLGLGSLVDELVSDHCREVNPNETTVPHALFDELSKSIPKTYMFAKKTIALEAYSREKGGGQGSHNAGRLQVYRNV